MELSAATRYEVLEHGMFVQDPKEPFAHGNAGTLVDTILGVVAASPLDVRRCLVQNVVLVGGHTATPGFVPRLAQDLLVRLKAQSRGLFFSNAEAVAGGGSGGGGSSSSSSSNANANANASGDVDMGIAAAVRDDESVICSTTGGPMRFSKLDAKFARLDAYHPFLRTWCGASMLGALEVFQGYTRDNYKNGTPMPDWVRDPHA